jgi:hypothetical protein
MNRFLRDLSVAEKDPIFDLMLRILMITSVVISPLARCLVPQDCRCQSCPSGAEVDSCCATSVAIPTASGCCVNPSPHGNITGVVESPACCCSTREPATCSGTTDQRVTGQQTDHNVPTLADNDRCLCGCLEGLPTEWSEPVRVQGSSESFKLNFDDMAIDGGLVDPSPYAILRQLRPNISRTTLSTVEHCARFCRWQI